LDAEVPVFLFKVRGGESRRRIAVEVESNASPFTRKT